MTSLKLSLFGPFQADRGGQAIKSFRTNKVQGLLVRVAAEPGEHSREKLMALLWPGMPDRSARHNLRQSLYHLRTIIPDVDAQDETAADPAVPLVLANRQAIELNPAARVEVDVRRFEALIDGTLIHDHPDLAICQACRVDLEQAVELYRGDFLADFFLDDSNAFEEWSQARREHYRRKALDALEILTTIHTRQQEYGPAAELAQRQLEIDNLRESAYRQLMEILALNGRRSEALAVYERCRQLLAEELGMAPSKRTTEIHDRIVAGDLRFDAPVTQGVRGYELLDEIGSGAYGTIHRAIQPAIGREVAVKVIRRRYASDPEFVRRFEAEAQMVARLEHPHIVPLYDYWRDPDGAYLVMRYLRGGNLQSAFKSGPWELKPALHMLDQITVALSAAHRLGVVHRDIKPANVLLDEAGNAYLTDFGIAKDLTGEMQLTTEGAVIGTPDYISPEQILNDPVTPQTDIYSLGSVLYETLTGEKPFPDSSVANLIYKHLNEPVPLISASRPGLPPQVDDVIQRATAKRPADRYSDALEMAEAFRHALHGDGAVATSALAVAIPLVTEVYNPFLGLRAFQEADADDFFGREALVQQLVARMDPAIKERITAAGDPRFLAVVGPSGSGKSSVVKAGLIPALRQGAIPGSEKWFVAEMVPGTHPLEELELALWPIAVDAPPSLVEPMKRDTRGLLRTIRRIMPDEPGAQLLLIIDQFEELFTLVEDEERRRFFLDSLLQALTSPRSPLRVVITLRADFYDRPLQYEALGRLLKENTEIILPLTSEELTWAIREPARRVGVRLEQGLTETIIGDLADQPGVLPLLQYALTELFERRRENGQGGEMFGEAYRTIGGVLGALGRRAEETFKKLLPEQQEAAQQLFLRLVTLGEGAEDTRRRVQRVELEAISAGDMPEVIDAFGAARLLTFDHDPVTRGPTVEVAHEALLLEWARLRGWLDQSRDDIRMQRLLSAAAVEWRAAGQEPGFLLREARLDQFAGWAANSSLAFTRDENDFLEASIVARQSRLAEEEDRRRRELETAKKLAETERARAEAEQQRAEEQAQATARLRQRAVLLTGALIVAGILALAAFFFAQQSSANAAEARENADLAATREVVALAEADQRATAQAVAEANEAEAIAQRATAEAEADFRAAAEAQAQDAQLAAEEEAQVSRSRELAAAALSNLAVDPELSILLALEALHTRYTVDAESALHQAIQASPLRQSIRLDSEGTITLATISPLGDKMYTSGDEGSVMWDLATGSKVFTKFHTINKGSFSPDGTIFVAPVEQQRGGTGYISILEAATGKELARILEGESTSQVAFSPDGKLIATIGDERTPRIWDLEATLDDAIGQKVQSFSRLDASRADIKFSPDGRYLASTTGEGNAVVWEVSSAREILTIGPDINLIAYSPDGTYLVSISDRGLVQVWDALLGDRISSLTISDLSAFANTIDFSPDGSKFAIGKLSGFLILIELDDGKIREDLTILGHDDQIGATHFSQDGKKLYSASLDGVVHIWDIADTGRAELGALSDDALLNDVVELNDGQSIVSAGRDGNIRVWDSQTWEEVQHFRLTDGTLHRIAISPDGSRVATGGSDGIVWLIDTNNWEQVLSFQAHPPLGGPIYWGLMDLEFSPDGRELVTASVLGSVKLWDSTTGEELRTLTSDLLQVNRVQYSPDGRFVAAGSVDETDIWDADTGQQLKRFVTEDWQTDNHYHWALDFSNDSSRIAFGRSDGIFEVWQLPIGNWTPGSQQPVLVSKGESQVGFINGIQFSPGGDSIFLGGFSDVAEKRNVESGDIELTLRVPGGVYEPALSGDGGVLYLVGFDGSLQVVLVDLDDLTALAQGRVTRSLTNAECQQYLHVDACPTQ